MIEIISHPGPDRSVTLEGLRTFKVRSRRYRNRRIGEFLKGLHLTEGRNTGFKKILDALAQNGSPLPEFETDEAHDYFITRLFVRKGFYSYENVAENVVENVADIFTPSAKRVLENYSKKRRKTAELLLEAIASDSNITIAEMAAKAGATTRTIQRYLQEFQNTGILLREGSDAAGKWILV